MMEDKRFMSETEPLLTPLYKVAYYILYSRADAEDAVQQGLLKAWAARKKARPESFRPWVTRIVINEARNIQRYRMRVTPMETVEPQADFVPPDPGVMEAVQTLPENLRIPFVLKYVMNHSERETAEALLLPISTIKSRLSRARQALQKALTEEG